MLSTRGLAVLAFAASIALAGCSGPTSAGSPPVDDIPSGASESIVEPASGASLSGSGYGFRAPEGWSEHSVAGLDAVAVDFADADGFSDNVNVVLSPNALTPDQIETLGVDELKGVGATNVKVRARVTVAGAESAHLSANFSVAGGYQIEQFSLTNDGQTYIVTFSFSSTVPEADRDDVSSSVLASWAWA